MEDVTATAVQPTLSEGILSTINPTPVSNDLLFALLNTLPIFWKAPPSVQRDLDEAVEGMCFPYLLKRHVNVFVI